MVTEGREMMVKEGRKVMVKEGRKVMVTKRRKVMRIKRIKMKRGRGRMMMISLVKNWKNKLGWRWIESGGDKKGNPYQRKLLTMLKIKVLKTTKMMLTTMPSRKRFMMLMKKKGMPTMTHQQQFRKN